MILGAVEAAAVAVPLLRAGFEFKMVTLKPTILANVLTLLLCFLLGVSIVLDGWKMFRCAGTLNADDGRELLRQKLGDLAAQLGTAREKIMMTALIAPLALLADVFRSESAAALPWFGLAVVYYLLFELLWRRYKKQVDQVMAEA